MPKTIHSSERVLRSQSFDPALPDIDDGMNHVEDGVVAQDGHPWRKCCGECALLNCDPQHYGSIHQETLRHYPADQGVFLCLHRHDEKGKYRVCAAFAACKRTDALAKADGQ